MDGPRRLPGRLPKLPALIALVLLAACRAQPDDGEQVAEISDRPSPSVTLQPRMIAATPEQTVTCVDRLGEVELVREAWVPVPLPYLVHTWRDPKELSEPLPPWFHDSVGELELAVAPAHARACGRSRLSFMRTPNELRLEARRFEPCHREIAHGSAAEVSVHVRGTVLPNGAMVDVRAESDIEEPELATIVEQCIEDRIAWLSLARSTPRFTHFELDVQFVGHPQNTPGDDWSRVAPPGQTPSCDSDELPHDPLKLPPVVVQWGRAAPLPEDGRYDPSWRRDYVGALHCDFVACFDASAGADGALSKWLVAIDGNPAGHPPKPEHIEISSAEPIPDARATAECLRAVFRDVRWPQHRSHPQEVSFRLAFDPTPRPLVGQLRAWTASEVEIIRAADPEARARLLDRLADSSCSHALLGLEAALIESGGVVDAGVEAELARVRETIVALPRRQAWSCQWSGAALLLAVLAWPLDGDRRSNSYILGAGIGAREALARVRPWLKMATELDPRIELALLAIAGRALYLGHMTHDEPGFLRKQ